MALRILQEHERQGAILVGVTATPLGLGGVYDELVVAGRTSDLRACGALVPCIHYGPDEPDLRHIVRVPLGVDLSEKDNRKAIMTPGIFGRVIHWYRRINPEQKPTILFAPGVPESIWFCEQFRKEKISCAHIDGKEVWIDGKTYPSTGPLRKEILDGSREKRFAVVANRFVLREGIDAPWLEHGIFATVFGSLQSYLQSGGRLLRANPGIKRVTLQDHGGNWWRHGSLNADREWRLGLTDRACAGEREDSFTYPKTETPSEPLRCPRCSCILTRLRCLCGWEAQSGQKSRPVIQADGNLKEMTGDIFKPRRISSSPDGPAIWREMYFRARSPKWNATFKQAEAMYYYEQGVWPDRRWPLMPKADHDFYRKVQDVTSEKLR
jgi:superfamily II DNA or RNA helicase